MKAKVKFCFLLVSMLMLMATVGSVVASAAETNVTMVVDPTTVNVGDTVVVTISNAEVEVESIGVVLSFDTELLECTEILGVDGDEYLGIYYSGRKGAETWADAQVGDTVAETNADGKFSFGWMTTKNTVVFEGNLATVSFTAKKEGTAEFSLTEKTTGTDAFTGVATTATVTIKSAAPACEHPNKVSGGHVNNNNGTHTSLTTCFDCGVVVDETISPCSFIDDGDCTTALECEYCLYIKTAAKDAHVAGADDGDCTTAIKCVNCEKNAVEAKAAHVAGEDDGDCTTAVKCVNCEKDAVAAAKEHSYTTKDSGKQSTPANCTNAAQNYVQCDNCNAVSKDKTVAVGEPNGHGKVDGFRLYSNYNGTHDVICNDCDKATEEDVTCTVDESQTTYGEGRPANCCEAGLQYKYTYCACGYEFGSADITIPATGDHTLVKYEKEAATCTTSGHEAYWMCDKLGFSFTDADGKNKIEDIHAWLSEGGDGYLPVDPTNHAGTEVTYTNNGDTHSATYDCCGAPFVTNEPHDYTTSPDANTCICGAEKAPDHNCVHDHYDKTETTHQSVCSCGKKIGEAEPHNYKTGTTEHICICGAVETFTLTVMDMPVAYSSTGAPNKTFTVPYGTNILAYIQEQIDCGKVDMSNQTVNDTIRIGVYVFDGHWTNISAGWGVVEENSIVDGDTEIAVKADFTGWSRASEDNTWGYEYKGASVVGWYEIDGNWYYFFKNEGSRYNFRAEGLSRVPYPTVEIMGNTYAPNAADIAYAESKGRDFIDATEAWFLFEDDGKFAYDSMGYVDHGDSQGKLINGMLPWHIGLVEVAAGEYRYFAGDLVNGGNLIATGKIYVSRNTTDLDVVIGGIYFFDENGKMILNDGIVDIKGTLYYYEDGRLAIDAGLVKVGDAYYYVRSGGEKAGQVVVGRKYWVSDTNGLLAAGMYEFDENGKMVIDPTVNANGIVEIDGVYYYYKAGVKQVGAGVVEMTDAEGETFYIYVRSNGQLATGEYWPTTTNGELERGCYDWGTDGRYYPAN